MGQGYAFNQVQSCLLLSSTARRLTVANLQHVSLLVTRVRMSVVNGLVETGLHARSPVCWFGASFGPALPRLSPRVSNVDASA